MKTESRLRIAVCGAGTAGLAVCLFLEKLGHEITLFERSPELKPLGAGLLLQPTGLQMLAELGLLGGALAHGERIGALLGQSASKKSVMAMRYAELNGLLPPDQCFGLGIQRGTLFELLRKALPPSVRIELGQTLSGCDSQTGVLQTMEGQNLGPFDLIIVADGAHSMLRAQFPALVKSDVAYPWGAVWCLVRESNALAVSTEAQDYAALRQRYRGAREMLGLLPVGKLIDAPESERKTCVFWSLPTAQFALFDQHGLGNWRSKVFELWPEAADLLSQIQHPKQLAKASYRDVVMSRWWQDKVVFIGDSAHGMSPQLGQGANMALLDARVLAQCIEQRGNDAQALSAALARYESERRRHIRIYQFASRWLTPLFQSDQSLGPILRDWFFYPLSRMPISKTQSLKILAGIQQGLLGRYRW